MNGDPQSTIAKLMESGSDTNPALNALLSDYTRFHAVLAALGVLFLAGVVILGVFCWSRSRKATRAGHGNWSFEKKVYFSVWALSIVLGLVLTLIVAAAFDSWLQSGSSQVPSLVQRKIDDRLAWQRPKAIVCSVLLVLSVVLTAHVWRTLIRRSRVPDARRRPREVLLMLAGLAAVPYCLLLMLMVMGNTQASLAPMSMTLFYG
jgi:hypothetical protein